MSQIKDYPDAASDEIAWEGLHNDEVILQRKCPDCDKGLLYYPARFCTLCAGTGLLTRTVKDER